MPSYSLPNLASYLKNVISYFSSRPWTREESLHLLLAYHVNYCFTPASIGRTRDKCETHYIALYMSALGQLGSDRGIQPDPIRIYYDNKTRSSAKCKHANGRVWCEEETRELFCVRNSKAPKLRLHTQEECFRHYYEVVGTVFGEQGSSLEEGIYRTVERFHKHEEQRFGRLSKSEKTS